MSDIKNIKDRVTSSRTVFVAENGKGQGIIIATGEILSLITTIESQKEEIELRDSEYQSTITKLNKLTQTINSHGPEGRNYTNQQYIDLLQKFESLKAITELAVKENDELKGDIQRIFERADEAFADQPDNYALSIALTMIRKWTQERLSTLSEIERLQNGTT